MIGVFDSGLGGLSILKAILQALPEQQYLYVGDSDRAPYGSRPSEEIYRFTLEGVDFLLQQGCEMVILACNTSSAEALRKIQKEYLPTHYPDRKVLGVIVPAAEDAAQKTRNHRIGVMATEGTVQSGAFVRELQKLLPDAKVIQQACPLLVALVESGEQNSSVAEQAIREYLEPLLSQGIDTLILGCTHYEHLLPYIEQVTAGRAVIISESEVIARKLKEYLSRHPELLRLPVGPRSVTFFSTDTTEQFKKLGSEFFDSEIQPNRIRLDGISGAL